MDSKMKLVDCRSITTQVSLIVLVVTAVNVLIQVASLRNSHGLHITYTTCNNNNSNNSIPATSQLHGYIISNQKERFHFASAALTTLNLTPHQHIPWPWNSAVVDRALQSFAHNSRKFHQNPVNLKMFSNRMAHTELLREFAEDSEVGMDSWRFFFEDDVAVHPEVAMATVPEVLAKAMAMAAADGLLHLGICAPASSGSGARELAPGIRVARTFGYCSHGYGVTKWRAMALLGWIDEVEELFFDVALRKYTEEVVKTWVVGVNLASPAPGGEDHFGILYQDRVKFPSSVNAPVPSTDTTETLPATRR